MFEYNLYIYFKTSNIRSTKIGKPNKYIRSKSFCIIQPTNFAKNIFTIQTRPF